MIIKFIIGSIIGWVVGSLLIAMLTTLRFNIPSCNALLKNKEEDEQVLKRMRKKYCISLLIWFSLILLVTFLCYSFLDNGFSGYITAVIFMILIGFKFTGSTENNMSRFYNSLKCNKF